MMHFIGRRLFATILAVYILTAAGYLAPGDEETMYRVTRNLALGQPLAIGREVLTQPSFSTLNFIPETRFDFETTSAIPGWNGSLYSKYALGQSLLAIPLFHIGLLLDNIWPMWPQLGPRLMMNILNPLCLAITGWVLFHFIIRLGYPSLSALFVSLAFGLSSMAWPYVNAFYAQPATGLFLLLTAFFFHHWQMTGQDRWAWGVGLALGAALLMRLTVVIAVPGLVLAMWFVTNTWERRVRVAGRMSLPLLAGIALSLWYNWLRFGALLESGYHEIAWTTPPLLGLYGLLFSSGKGIFLYTPLLLLSVAALPLFFKQHPSLVLLTTGWWIAYLAFYAPYNFWTGGFNWGPRFLLPLVAISLLPCAAVLETRKNGLNVVLFMLLFVVGMAIQFPAVVVDHARYLIEQEQTGDERFYDKTIFIPAFSPIIRQPEMAFVVFNDFSQAERRAVMMAALQRMDLPPADMPINRYSAQRVLQTNVIRLNLPAIWWLHLPLWGIPVWLTALLVSPWIALLLWGMWGLRPSVLRRLKDETIINADHNRPQSITV